MGTKKKGKEPKALKAARKGFIAELSKHVKAAKVKTKKVEIRGEGQGWSFVYAFARPNAETWATGYARPFTAKRGAMRHFKEFIAKGGVLQFINNY